MTLSNFMDRDCGGGGPLKDAFRARFPNSGIGSLSGIMRSLHFFFGGGGGGGDGLAMLCGGRPFWLS